MWVIDDKFSSLLANTGDLTYIGEPLIIVIASSTLDVARGPVFLNIPLTVVKNFPWQNVLKETKSHIFCLFIATADSVSISVLPTNCSKVQ